jgi:hypothetical protein
MSSAGPVCEPEDLTVEVRWDRDGAGGLRGRDAALARVYGPPQPECAAGKPDNLSSSWFGLTELPATTSPR